MISLDEGSQMIRRDPVIIDPSESCFRIILCGYISRKT